jgi:tetratricopeptide (TPR) repeat protein
VLARRFGDPRVLAQILTARIGAIWSTDNPEQRLALADEELALATTAGAREEILAARHNRAVAHLELGDLAGFRTEVRRFAVGAAQLRLPWYGYWAAIFASTLAMAEGRFADADAAIVDALATSRRLDTFERGEIQNGVAAQLLLRFRDSGRLYVGGIDELDAIRRSMETYVRTMPEMAAWRAGLAMVKIFQGRDDEARDCYEALTAPGMRLLAPDAMWTCTIIPIVELCVHFGDLELAAELRTLLLPYAERCAVVTFGFGLLGSFEHYLGMLAALLGDLDEAGDHFPVPALPGAAPQPVSDRPAAQRWFDGQSQVLLTAVRTAVRAGLGDHGWQLAWALAGYLDREGRWHDWHGIQTIALDAARRAGSRVGHAHAHRDLGKACSRLGRHDDAHDQLVRALEMFRTIGDRAGLAHTHLSLGQALEREGRLEAALGHSHEALRLFASAGNAAGHAYTLNAVGWQFALLGDHRQAADHCWRAISELRLVGDIEGEADAWDSLGFAHHQLGDHRAAISCFGRALDAFGTACSRYAQAGALIRLGESQLALADAGAAETAWRQALTILQELGHPDPERVRERLR